MFHFHSLNIMFHFRIIARRSIEQNEQREEGFCFRSKFCCYWLFPSLPGSPSIDQPILHSSLVHDVFELRTITSETFLFISFEILVKR
jgi:hypothetical protein